MRERENWGPEEKRLADELREAFRDSLDRFELDCDRNGSVDTVVGVLQYDHAKGIFLLEGVNLISSGSIESLCAAAAALAPLYHRCRKRELATKMDMERALGWAQAFLSSFPRKP
jgi:hypothetical protein